MKHLQTRERSGGQGICLDPASYGLFVASGFLFFFSFVFYVLSLLVL